MMNCRLCSNTQSTESTGVENGLFKGVRNKPSTGERARFSGAT